MMQAAVPPPLVINRIAKSNAIERARRRSSLVVDVKVLALLIMTEGRCFECVAGFVKETWKSRDMHPYIPANGTSLVSSARSSDNWRLWPLLSNSTPSKLGTRPTVSSGTRVARTLTLTPWGNLILIFASSVKKATEVMDKLESTCRCGAGCGLCSIIFSHAVKLSRGINSYVILTRPHETHDEIRVMRVRSDLGRVVMV
jgi:hypothetical protein